MIDRPPAVAAAREVVRVARSHQLTLLAAGVAFFAFLSLVPLALLVVGLSASLGGDWLVDFLVGAASDVLTAEAQELLAGALVEEAGRRSATVVGALALLWGGSRVFRALDQAFSRIYGTVSGKSVVDTFWDVLIVATAIVVGLSLVALLEVLLAFAPLPQVGLVAPALILTALVAAFLPLYVVFPDAGVTVREALPGTLIAAVGWLALSRSFAIYATFATESAVYGALGAVLLVLVWLYAGAVVLVLGAVVNAVLAGHARDRQLQSPGNRRTERPAMTEDGTDRDGASAGNGGRDGGRAPPDDGSSGRPADVPPDRASDGVEAASTAAAAADARDRTRDRSDDPAALREEIERLREEVETLESDVTDRTVHRDSIERDLKRYVRRRVRRGHAAGWGPYLVLLYGTVMTIAAFRFLDGGWAILAMLVVWTSTLGVYVLMVVFGTASTVLGLPGRLRDRIGEWRG